MKKLILSALMILMVSTVSEARSKSKKQVCFDPDPCISAAAVAYGKLKAFMSDDCAMDGAMDVYNACDAKR